MIDASHRPARAAGPLRRLAAAWRERLRRRTLAADRPIVKAIVAELSSGQPAAAHWTIRSSRPGDPSLFVLGPPAGEAGAVVRIAHTRSSRAGLRRAATALEAIRGSVASPGLGIRPTVPVVLARSDEAEPAWLAESVMPGIPATATIGDSTVRIAVLRATAAAARSIADVAPETIDVGPAEIERWVTSRTEAIRSLLPAVGLVTSRTGRLPELAAEVSAGLAGRTLRVGWIHGDLWPANVLVEPGSWRVSGLVDWDSALPGEPILQDLLHLALTTRRRIERRDLGALLVELLGGAAWAAEDRIVLGIGGHGGGATDPAPSHGATDADPLAGLDRSTALRLYWLRAIESNLLRHPGLGADRRWVEVNVLRVLACP